MPVALKQSRFNNIHRYQIVKHFIPELKEKFYELLKAEFFFENTEIEKDSAIIEMLRIVFNWVIGEFEPNKGFVLTGTYGNGKSSVMKAAMKLMYIIYGKSENYIHGISEPVYVSAKRMARHFIDNERFKINQLIYADLLGIDDVGYESKEVKTMGTLVYPFEEILMERYDRKKIVLITTNKTAEEIESIYGGHILDRLNQMCFWIEINSPSKRT